MAGGRWDRLERRFLDPDEQEPETVAVIEMVESQVEFTSWFATFLRDFREGYPRDVSLALAAGDRRGGKTFDTYYCQIAALIDVPILPSGVPALGWTISRTFQERHELDELLAARIPKSWYTKRQAPERIVTFRHGSILRNLSADDPDTLKQGRVDWLLFNEPQKMSPRAVKNGLYGTSDQAGLTILAANPPSPTDREWLIDLKEAIDAEEADRRANPKEGEPQLGAMFFNFDSKLNPTIDHPARRRVARLAGIIDPDGAEADASGEWRRWGTLAYPAWSGRLVTQGGMVGELPEIGSLTDVTSVITNRLFWQPRANVIGADFQFRPHQAGAVARLYQDEDGRLIYWFHDELLATGNEEKLSLEAYSKGYEPGSALWIADCSGSFQGSERIPGVTSYNILESHGWSVQPAETIKLPERSAHPRNPDVGHRLMLARKVAEEGRLRVTPSCAWLIRALSKCEVRKTDYGKLVPKGRESHITDALSYVLYRLEPKPDAPKDWSLQGFGSFPRPSPGSPFPTRSR